MAGQILIRACSLV